MAYFLIGLGLNVLLLLFIGALAYKLHELEGDLTSEDQNLYNSLTDLTTRANHQDANLRLAINDMMEAIRQLQTTQHQSGLLCADCGGQTEGNDYLCPACRGIEETKLKGENQVKST